MAVSKQGVENLWAEFSRLDEQHALEKKTIARLRRLFYGSVALCVLAALDIALVDLYFPHKPILDAIRLPLLMWAMVVTVHVFRTLSILEAAAEERTVSMKRRDDLTGTYSLAYCIYALGQMRGLSPGRAQELAVGYVRIVGIDEVNGRFGHAAGSVVIKNLAQITSDALPYGALLCRMGGVEFAAFMPETAEKEAHAILSKIHDAVRDLEIDLGTRGVIRGLDAHIGLTVDTGARTVEDLMRAAYENARAEPSNAAGPTETGKPKSL